MSNNKVPKRREEISTSKIPKTLVQPAAYKALPISWQISRIDNGGDWGLNNLRDEYIFHESDLAISLDSIHDDLANALMNLNKSSHTSYLTFIKKVLNKSNYNILPAHIEPILDKLTIERIFHTIIYPNLKHFENSTWETIEKEQHDRGRTKHHSIMISALTPKAQRRLKELKMEDVDEVFSLRLNNKIRIIGIRRFSFLDILWIDLNHEVSAISRG